LQNGLQKAGLAKALKIKPRRMPINAYVASRAAKPAGLTRAAPAEKDFPTARMPVDGACEFEAAPPTACDRPGASGSVAHT
jgi:hypothetical protein